MTVEPAGRPRVILSVAVSADGFINDAGPARLILSGPEDWDAIDALRADCDAILVGAGTVRADDPRLVIRSEARRQARRSRGLPPDPVKVTLTATGDLDPGRQFFTTGDGTKLVYSPANRAEATRERVGAKATVIPLDDTALPGALLGDLSARGIRTLLVEGGTTIHTLFLGVGVVDELRLAVCPVFVGDARAPRFVNAAHFPHAGDNRMSLDRVERFGDVAVMWYRLKKTDLDWLSLAIELSRKCPKSDTSFAVGAVLLDATGELLSTGYSLELGPAWHAEEVALARAGDTARGGTLYSSLEPCSVRLSGKRSCAEHLIAAGIRRVVFALKEPPVFVPGVGGSVLSSHRIEVVHRPELGPLVEDVNRHLLTRSGE